MQRLLTQPFHFEARSGDAAHGEFVAEGPGYGVTLSPEGVSVVLLSEGDGPNRAPQQRLMNGPGVRGAVSMLGLALVGANPDAKAQALAPFASTSNYFIGTDRRAWRTGVTQYERLQYDAVYPGVDVVYYGNGGRLEHDFVVHPGADPRHIALQFAGRHPQLNDAGDLEFSTDAGMVRLLRPVAYQERADGSGVRRAVDCHYQIAKNGTISFTLGDYDHAIQLTIDPVLQYSTTFGSYDVVNGITVDSSGNIYVTGQAYVSFGITTKNPVLSPGTGTYNAFVSKINPTTNTLLFSTFVGGNNDDEGNAIALDGLGNIFITGSTDSTTFPTLNAAQSSLGTTSVTCSGACSKANAFVTALKNDGSALLYSTYLGGNALDVGYGIAADATGNAYVTGSTTSSNFPLASALQSSFNQGASCSFCTDAFVTKFSLAGQIQYSTYLGGSGSDAGYSIAVDSNGAAYVTGVASNGYPVKNAVSLNGTVIGNYTFCCGVAITKINPAGSALVWSNNISTGTGSGIALDSLGNIYVAGFTTEPGNSNTGVAAGIPTTTGALNTTDGGSFVMKLSADGTTVVYSTLLGGNGTDFANSVAVDSSFDAWVAGYTTSTNYPTASPLVAEGGGYFLASSNGGTTFAAANSGLLPLSITSLVLDPNSPGTLLVSQDNVGSLTCTALLSYCGGLFTSTNAGATWSRLSPSGMTDVRVYQIARSQSSPGTLYALTPSGLFRSIDNGVSYTLATGTNLPTLTNPVFTIDPFTSSRLYLESSSNILYTSTDGGNTWTGSGTTFPANRNVGPIVADPIHSGTLYTTCNSLIWKSTTSGATWASLTTPFSPNSITLDPSNPTTIYATTTFTPYYKSTDGGMTWTQSPSSLFGSNSRVMVDPTNSLNVYVFFNPGSTYESTNGGTSFSLTTFSGIPVIDPTNNQNVYIPTGSRNTGFLSELNPTGSALLFSTYASGTYHSQFGGVALDTSGNAYVAGFTDGGDFGSTTSGVSPSIEQPVGLVGTQQAPSLVHANLAKSAFLGGSTGFGTPTSVVVVYTAYKPVVLAMTDQVTTPAYVGANVTYTLTVSVSGGTAHSVVVGWSPSALTSFVSATSALFQCNNAAPIQCTMGALSPGTQATITIVAKVNSAGDVTDSATASASDVVNSVVTSATVTATAAPPALSITDSAPATVVSGQTYTYTLYITNTGGTTATNLSLTWTPPTNFFLASVKPGLFTCSGALSCTLPSLAPQAITPITITGSYPFNGTISDSVNVNASNAPTATASAATLVQAPNADLSVDVKSIVPLVEVGAQDPIELEIVNAGPTTALAPVLTVSPSVSFPFVDEKQCPLGKSYSGATQSILTCKLNDLPAGATKIIPLSVYAGQSPNTSQTVAYSVSSSTFDPNSANNSGTTSFEAVTPEADLGLTASFFQGKTLQTVTFYVTNYGPYTSIPTITVDLTGFTIVGGEITLYLCPFGTTGVGTSNGTCTLRYLAPGKTAHGSVIVASSGPATGSFFSSVSGSVVDPNVSNNIAIGTIVPTNPPPQSKVIVSSNSSVKAQLANNGVSRPFAARPDLQFPGNASGVAFDNPGNTWVAASSSVVEYNSSQSLIATYTGGGLGGSNNNTAGIAIDGDAQIWVPNSNGSLTGLNSSGTALSPSTGFAAGLNGPSGVAVDNAGTVWITNSGNNSVTRIFGAASPATTPLSNANYNGTFGVRP